MSVFLTGCGNDALGDKYVSFAKCVTEKGAKMYGSYTCPHCANQKKMLGKEAFKEINYIECHPQGPKSQAALCEQKGISGVPDWEFADGTHQIGEITLEELSAKTKCSLPQDPVLSGTSTTAAALIQ